MDYGFQFGVTSLKIRATCPICEKTLNFNAPDEYWSPRDRLESVGCPFNRCVTRERALARVLFDLYSRKEVTQLSIHECSPVLRGISLWVKKNCPDYLTTGFFPGEVVGQIIHGTRNENLEAQTFADEIFDLVFHLYVLEHLFNPFQALKEIARTLKPNGVCLFTVPVERGRLDSEQVAFQQDGKLTIVGEPEYHGNPQRPDDGALVTWRYGEDLPLQIYRRAGLDVEHRRFQCESSAVMGYMDDVYILRKRVRI